MDESTVILKSCDGTSIPVRISEVGKSRLIKGMLELLKDDKPADQKEVDLPNVNEDQLKIVTDWMKNNEDSDVLKVTMETLLSVIAASNYLDIQELLEEACKSVAYLAKSKTPGEMHALFHNPTMKSSVSEGETQYSDAPVLRRTSSPKSSVSEDHFGMIEAEVYEGIDTSLHKKSHHRSIKNRCENCITEFMGRKYEVDDLKTCSRCKLMRYCSVQCQKKDWNKKEFGHKELCKEISSMTVRVSELTEALRQYTDWDENTYDLWQNEESVGHFWGMFGTRDYCRARYDLGSKILKTAYSEDDEYLYEIGLAHLMELLRLIHGDNLGIRHEVPYYLLNMNRDQDAYDFIKWWATIDPHGTYDWGKPPPSQEGDWLYLRNEDIFECLLDVKGAGCSFEYLPALMAIKMRILAKHQQRLSEFVSLQEYIEEFTTGTTVTDNLPLIKKYLVGDTAHCDVMEPQRDHLDRIMKKIDEKNKIFLPAVLNPRPLKSQPPPASYSAGSAEEAYMVLINSNRLIVRIPGAEKRIRAFLGTGKIPTYDPTFLQK